MRTTTERRSVVKKILASFVGMVGLGTIAKAGGKETGLEKQVGHVTTFQDIPLYSGHTKYGNLVFLSGKGAHFEGDIVAHTENVLDEIQEELEKAGSSMDKVLKVNVYLADLNDYKKMNETYKGRFGSKPPVRTTVATYGGVPGGSLVEIDCIAYV